jgi:hypothetical protein
MSFLAVGHGEVGVGIDCPLWHEAVILRVPCCQQRFVPCDPVEVPRHRYSLCAPGDMTATATRLLCRHGRARQQGSRREYQSYLVEISRCP